MLRFLETISLKEIQHEPLDFFFLFFYLLGATFFFPFEPPTIENKRRNGAPCHYSFRVFPGISIKETRDARERPISPSSDSCFLHQRRGGQPLVGAFGPPLVSEKGNRGASGSSRPNKRVSLCHSGSRVNRAFGLVWRLT